MLIEQLAITKLKLDPENVRKHSEANIAAIKRSLERFGQQKPIVVNAKNVVIAGNGTVEAARQLGWDDISVFRTTLKGHELRAYGIADNRTNETSEWDNEALNKALKEIADFDFDLGLATGFDEKFLENLGKEKKEHVAFDADSASEFLIVVELDTEKAQQKLFEDLAAKGFKCKLM